jgi:hypothetical protein
MISQSHGRNSPTPVMRAQSEGLNYVLIYAQLKPCQNVLLTLFITSSRKENGTIHSALILQKHYFI